jgi:hypothetical protein
MSQQELSRVAQAYVYGYPLVYSMQEIGKLVAGTSGITHLDGFNVFGAARNLLGPDADFVSPNNDTLYLAAVGDVRRGPLLLDVPDTQGRYYVLQFIDAWTNNFAYVGRRATGTEEGSFLLAEAGYDGPVPDGTTLIEAPGGVFVIGGRVQVDGAEDLPAVHALQDAFKLRPLEGSLDSVGLPTPDPAVPESLAWWEHFRVALAAFPPPNEDAQYLHGLEALGLTSPGSHLVDAGSDQAEQLVAGAAEGQALIEKLASTPGSAGGWTSAMHIFDYNLDRCGPGTMDTPEWKIEDRAKAYVTRAFAARAGLWGNHGYEADYEAAYTDDRGEPLNGQNSYELRLETPPPVDAFWSLTMYDAKRFYLVDNPIDRYSIGDRTPGLVVADDGSITIRISNESPGKGQESNWLPAPDGPFRPLLRMYQPRQPVFDGTYVLPAIRKVS